MTKQDKTSGKPVVVVGDGWAALAAVAWLATEPEARQGGRPEILWIAGSTSRILSPLPSLESSPEHYGAVETLLELANRLGIDPGQEHSGNFLREFKNKAFRQPAWTQLEESLWEPERSIAHCFETRFDRTLAELEEEIRAKLEGPAFPNLRRIDGNAFSGVRVQSGSVTAAILASGEEIECESVIYAGRWSALGKIQGLPKSPVFARRRDPHGLLQTTFIHSTPVGAGVLEGFFSAMNREAGEELERRVWGYFSADGMKSHWTVCCSADESEDNHEIAKKLRRLKQTLEKMFAGSEWFSEAGARFLANIRDEQVRFEESFIFGAGERPTEVVTIPELKGISFLTDGYGPSCSFRQVRLLLNPISGPKEAPQCGIQLSPSG